MITNWYNLVLQVDSVFSLSMYGVYGVQGRKFLTVIWGIVGDLVRDLALIFLGDSILLWAWGIEVLVPSAGGLGGLKFWCLRLESWGD